MNQFVQKGSVIKPFEARVTFNELKTKAISNIDQNRSGIDSILIQQYY